MEDTIFPDGDVVMQDQDEIFLPKFEGNIITILPSKILLKILIFSITKNPSGLAQVRRVCKEFQKHLSIKHCIQSTEHVLKMTLYDHKKTTKFREDNTIDLQIPVIRNLPLKNGMTESRILKRIDKTAAIFFQNLNYLAYSCGMESIGEICYWILVRMKSFDEYHRGLDIKPIEGQFEEMDIYRILVRNSRFYVGRKIALDKYDNLTFVTIFKLGKETLKEEETVVKNEPIWWIRF